MINNKYVINNKYRKRLHLQSHLEVTIAFLPLFDNDLLLKAFREFLAALASALYLFLIVEVFSELALFLLLKRI